MNPVDKWRMIFKILRTFTESKEVEQTEYIGEIRETKTNFRAEGIRIQENFYSVLIECSGLSEHVKMHLENVARAGKDGKKHDFQVQRMP